MGFCDTKKVRHDLVGERREEILAEKQFQLCQLLISCVTLAKQANLSEPQFPNENSTTHPVGETVPIR